MKKGFTLIELLTSFAIIAAVSSVVIFNHKKFNDNLEITNLSFRIGIALRQAQVYGVSTREIKPTNTISLTEAQRFGLAYGVHFDLNYTSTTLPKYIFFADKNPNEIYNSNDDITLETTTIGRGNRISRICVLVSQPPWTCSLANTTSPFFTTSSFFIDITFKRPEPDAIFRTNDGSLNGAEIQLTSPAGRVKYIIIYSTGQISVTDTPIST